MFFPCRPARGFISSHVFCLQINRKQKDGKHVVPWNVLTVVRQLRKLRKLLRRVVCVCWHSLHWIPYIYSADTTHSNRKLLGKMTCSVITQWRSIVRWPAEMREWAYAMRQPNAQAMPLFITLCVNTHTAHCRCGRSQRLLLATQRITSCWGSHCASIKLYFNPHLIWCRRISAKPRRLALVVAPFFRQFFIAVRRQPAVHVHWLNVLHGLLALASSVT